MNIMIYPKTVVKKFVSINNMEFDYGELSLSIEQMLETRENDSTGDYSLRDYEVSYPDVLDKLVYLDLVKKYKGSREATLYCVKDKKRLEILMDFLQEYIQG